MLHAAICLASGVDIAQHLIDKAASIRGRVPNANHEASKRVMRAEARDTDLEPSLAGFDGVNVPTDDQEGGDVLDEGEPNDWDGEDSDTDEDGGDDEPLGWSNPDLASGRPRPLAP